MPIDPPDLAVLAAFKAIQTVDDVARFFGTTRKRLFFYLYSNTRPMYMQFSVAKASGALRLIESPPSFVARLQRRLLQCMTAIVQPSRPSHGFIVCRSVATNAKPHRGKALVLNLDLKDFFHSIHFGRVRGIFGAHPFDFGPPASAIFAQVCCHDGRLPQGAPTSPLISNLACRGLDRELEKLAKHHKAAYTRYADDITFSTNLLSFDPSIVAFDGNAVVPGPAIAGIVGKHSFSIQTKKFRVQARGTRQQVTGLVVNVKVNVPRAYIRKIRAITDSCFKLGIPAADVKFKVTYRKHRRVGHPPLVIEYLRGSVDYLGMVRGHDDKISAESAIKLERLAPWRKWGTRLFGRSALDVQTLKEAVWVILGYDAGGTIASQGTAFVLRGYGAVTAGHVVAVAAHKWELIHASNPHERIVVTGARSHPHPFLDLAILEIDATKRFVACLDRSTSPTVVNDPLHLAGFPQWNTPADVLSFADSTVIQKKSVSGINHLLAGAFVRGGSSGGPALDRHGLVAGVIVADSTHKLYPSGSVEVSHLDLVAGQPLRSLP